MRNSFVLAIAILCSACAAEHALAPPSPATASGVYTLTSVDGSLLPFTVLDLGAYKSQIGSASLKLTPDGKYSFAIGIRIDDSGNIRFAADSDAGVWTLNDHAIAMTSTLGNLAKTATVSGDMLTMQASTRVFVMKR